jgi:hypothetical protein
MADSPMARYAPPRQRQQRMLDPLLDQHEHGQQDHPRHQQRNRRRRAPARGVGLRQPVDHRHQPGHHQHRSRPVDLHVRIPGLYAEQPHRARDRDDAQDDVDVQAPPPGQVLGQHPPQQQPHRPASSGDGAVDAERLAALGRVGECHGQRGQRGRGQQRAERPLRAAADHQQPEAGRRAAHRRGGGEAHQADDQHPPPAEQIRQSAPEQQQPAEGQRVRRHHPLPVGIGEPQRMLGRGQRDVHDRGVQDHHQLGQPDHAENPPAPRRIRVRVRLPSPPRYVSNRRLAHSRSLRPPKDVPEAALCSRAARRQRMVGGLRPAHRRNPRPADHPVEGE